MGIDRKKISCQTKQALIIFSKACCGSVRGHPFLYCILVFFVLLYAFFPATFFFLLSNSPVIICTAILLGTLLSFGHPHIPEICEEKEENTRVISSFKADGGVDLIDTEKDGNSEMEVPLLEKQRNTLETIEEEGTKKRNLGDGGENKAGDSLHLEMQKKDERGVSGGATDEADLAFTPRQGRLGEGLGQGTGRLEKAIHESRLAGNSKSGASLDDSSNRGKFYCRSNSRRTVRFVMNDVEKDKEESKVEEDHDDETKHKADDFEVRDKAPETYVEDSFTSSLGSPWIRIDRQDQSASGLDHDDQLSHSSSEHVESSSPGASMADILPMLDELHPLLDSEIPQPASLEPSEANSEQSSENHYSDDEDDNDEDDDGSTELEKEGSEKREGEKIGHEAMSGVKWTDDDTKNVMDLGSSELERNRRLENLMAKRRARRNQRIELEKDLIDLQSDERISLLDMDDSSFNILDSVSIQASPFLVRSATLPSIKRNPFDLPCDGEKELAEAPVPASARASSTFSAKRNPFDLPYDHAGVDGMLTGETSNHGDFMAVQLKGLFTNEPHLLGGSQFSGFDGFSPVNSPVYASIAEPVKQQSGSSFHGLHAADMVGKDIPQVTTCNRDVLEERVFSSIQQGSTDCSMSCLFQTQQKDHELHDDAHRAQIIDATTYDSVEPGDSDSLSSPERDSDSDEEEEKHMEAQRRQGSRNEVLAHYVESVASDIIEEHVQEPESFDHHVVSSSHFTGLEEESEMPSEEMQMKSRKVHMEVARLGSPEHVIHPLDESPSKQYVTSDVVEEDFDDSSSSTSSDREVQFGGNVNEEKKSFRAGASTSASGTAQPCSREPDILIKQTEDNRVGEPVFDSSPSAQEKSHSGLPSSVEGDRFAEKGIFPFSSRAFDTLVESSEQGSRDIEVEKNIVHEFKEETADREGKSEIKPTMAFSESEDLLADVSVAVADDQSHISLSNLPRLPVVKEAVIETIQPSNSQEKADDIHVAESSPRGLIKDSEVFADVHAHPFIAQELSTTAAISIGDPPVTTSEKMPPKGDEPAVFFSAGDYHVTEVVKDSYGNAHEDCLQSTNALLVDHPLADLTSTGSQVSEPEELHQSSSLSDMEHGSSEIIQDGSHDESPKNIHVASTEATRQDIVDENYVSTSRVNDDMDRPNCAEISKSHLGADHDVWAVRDEDVACVKDLDEDILTELDRIGDFKVAEETTSMNKPQNQLEMHSDGEPKDDAETDDLIQMPVLEAKSIEDISHGLKQFPEGESSEANEDKSESSYGQSELEAAEAQSLDDMEELMMQLSKEFSEKHGDGFKVTQRHDLFDEQSELEIPGGPREDVELVAEQINKDDVGDATGTAFTKEQKKEVKADDDKSEPKSADSVPNSTVDEVYPPDDRESDGYKKDIHYGDRKEEVHHSSDVHHGDRKEEVDHSSNADTTDADKSEPKSADTVVVHEVCSFDERESNGDMKESTYHDDKKEEVQYSSNLHHADRKEDVDHNSDASTEHVESKGNKIS